MKRINPWTEERKAKLKQWWLVEQYTATRIAELFGKDGWVTTKNAVIGQVHRSEWWEGMSRVKHPPKPGAGRKRKIRPVIITVEPPPPPPIKLRTPPPMPLPVVLKNEPRFLGVVEIGPNQCRYWFGESHHSPGPATQTGYCGRKVSAGHASWCDEHLRLVYARTPPQPRVSIPHKF